MISGYYLLKKRIFNTSLQERNKTAHTKYIHSLYRPVTCICQDLKYSYMASMETKKTAVPRTICPEHTTAIKRMTPLERLSLWF